MNTAGLEKVIRDGKVAILYAPGFGAGWFSWNTEHPEILFHPKLVELVEAGRNAEITNAWLVENLGLDFYTGGAEDLRIRWLPQGTVFEIKEYDGNESVYEYDHDDFLVA